MKCDNTMWLSKLILDASDNNWCTNISCTTCGCFPFKKELAKILKSKAVRFSFSHVQPELIEEENQILVVTENGYGKRTKVEEYRQQNRGGKGVKTLNITEKTGKLLSIKNVTDEEDLMIITKAGVAIRMHIDTIRTMGRAAQGVKLINLKGNSSIAAVARVPKSEEEEGEFEGEDGIQLENPENGTDIENDSVE